MPRHDAVVWVRPDDGRRGDCPGDGAGRRRRRGVSSSIDWLSPQSAEPTRKILFRALQGLGGGGLIVGAQAIIGDVVSPRDRGRYQGIFGAVFGVSSVAGPLLGGFFVEHLSWQWIFYVNLPIGAIALVIAAVLPASVARRHHAIDWLGAALLTAGVSCLILFLSLGGSTQPWEAPRSLALAVGGLALLLLFALAERRAQEPILPLRLFSNRVFAVASAIGFVVGFGLFGAVTFLPLFLQVVGGASATASGLQMVPMMVGVLLTSIASGQVIARTGRYKPFPIAGTAIAAGGFTLLATMDPQTTTLQRSAYMLVLGLGLGMTMQVLVLAVQNAVDYRDLGVATSGATFFRSIGGSFGVAVFGTIFSNRLASELPGAGRAEAYSEALSTVFLVAVPVVLTAFALTWLLREVPLRRTVETAGVGESFAIAKPDASYDEIARAISVLARRDTRRRVYERLAARAGVELSPAAVWLLGRIAEQGPVAAGEVAERCGVAHERIAVALEELRERAQVEQDDAGLLTLSPAGRATRERLRAARRDRLAELLAGWSPEQHEELAALLSKLADDLARDPGDALPAVGAGARGKTGSLEP